MKRFLIALALGTSFLVANAFINPVEVASQIGYTSASGADDITWPITTDPTNLVNDDVEITVGADGASFEYTTALNRLEMNFPSGGFYQVQAVGVGTCVSWTDAASGMSISHECGASSSSTAFKPTPAAGTSGNIVEILSTDITAMNSSDTVSILDISITNANHTGTSNVLNGIRVETIVGDAEADETAIIIGDDWDQELKFEQASARIEIANSLAIDTGIAAGSLTYGNAGTGFRFIHTPTVGANAVAFEVLANNPVMNGSDEYSALDVDISLGNHTGTGNTVNLIRVDALTGDANTNLNGLNIDTLTPTTGAASEVETAIRVGDGWDNLITSDEAGTVDLVEMTGTSSTLVIRGSGEAAKVTIKTGSVCGTGAICNLFDADTGKAGYGFEIDGTFVVNDGSDESRGLFIDYTNANHTGTANFVNLIEIDPITGDANSNLNGILIGALTPTTGAAGEDEYGIKIETGWDRAIVIEDDAAEIQFSETTTATARLYLGGQSAIRFVGPGSVGTASIELAGVMGVGDDIGISIQPTMAAANGDDISKRVNMLAFTSSGASGVNNGLYDFYIDTLTSPDAQMGYVGLHIQEGRTVGIESESPIFDRMNFNEPLRVLPASLADSTIDLADGDVNYVVAAEGIQFEYREEQTKTTSSMIFTATGGLDISADNTTADEGVEIYLGASQNTTTGYIVAQTDRMCFAVNLTVALIAGTDQVTVGWRANAAYDAAANYLNYTDYAIIGINNVDGSIFAEMDSTTGAAQTDDTGTDWANAETKTLKVCISADGETHHYLDGTLVTEVNVVDVIDSGIIMNPFITYLQADGATDAGVVINWWELTGI